MSKQDIEQSQPKTNSEKEKTINFSEVYGEIRTEIVKVNDQFQGLNWQGFFKNMGEFFGLLLSGVSGIFSKNPEKYDFEGRYYRFTGERLTPEETKPERLKEAWEKSPGIYTRPDGTATDPKTGEILSPSEIQAKIEQAKLEAMQKGQSAKYADMPGKPSKTEKSSAGRQEEFHKASSGTVDGTPQKNTPDAPAPTQSPDLNQ